MNNGQGFKAEFFENNKLEGQPKKTDYTKSVRYSTFGAWGFAEGVSSDNISVRLSGSFKADFTGDMSYNISSDNGYMLTVRGSDGSHFEKKGEPGAGGRGGFGGFGGGFGGFGRGRGVQYETFEVKDGVTYTVVIEYNRGTGQFANLNAEVCQNKLVDFVDVVEAVKNADVIICIGGISARMEGEGGDKQTIELPAVQQRMIKAMHATGKPVVFVNCSGSAIAFGSATHSFRLGILVREEPRHLQTYSLATTTHRVSSLLLSIAATTICQSSPTIAWTTALIVTSVDSHSMHSVTDFHTPLSALVQPSCQLSL